jgi:subtilase family serine protease
MHSYGGYSVCPGNSCPGNSLSRKLLRKLLTVLICAPPERNMRRYASRLRILGLFLCMGMGLWGTQVYAFQTQQPQSLNLVLEHVPVWARSLRDLGPVPDTAVLSSLTLVVARDPGREQEFQELLRDQYDTGSSRYHRWLAPRELGERYGADQATLDHVSDWLRSKGLRVESVSNSRVFITFGGTIASLSSAFSTAFHYFDSNGEKLISITAEPRMPSDIASKVRFVAGLSTVKLHPSGSRTPVTPDYDETCSTPPCSHNVSPADFAAIYGLNPVYMSGIKGSGETIAVVGLSRVADSDIELFQQLAGLPVTPPVQSAPGADPGPPNLGANIYQIEATADVERAFGVAPDATVLLDVTASGQDAITNLLNVPIADVIDNNRAPILTISFSQCETVAGMPQVLLADALFHHAAAEGISVFASAGDSGVADCAAQGQPPPASGTIDASLNINYLCSSSYVTCVGGTEFNDTADPTLYWSKSNSADLLSALGYIKEGVWNESTDAILVAGSGGTSQWIPQPPWQAGIGVPANGGRNIPDIAFTASMHDSYYLCFAEANGDGDCSKGKHIGFYGTSGSTPSMAGIMALVDEALGARQGNFNPTLYSLAATPENGVFNDVTVPSSGVTNCSVYTPSLCNNSIALSSGSAAPVLPGFSVDVGYDLATGWGSINVANLLATMKSQPLPAPSTTYLTLSSTNISTAQNTALTIQVAGSVGTPQGTVQIMANGIPTNTPLSLDFGQATLQNLTFPTAGTFSLTAVYSGSTSYSKSTSAPVILVSNLPTFLLAPSPTSLTISTPGEMASSTVTVTTNNGFVGAVALACSVSGNDISQNGVSPTCSFANPGGIVLSSTSQSATLALTVSTTSGHAVGKAGLFDSRNPAAGFAWVICVGLLGTIPLRRGRVRLSNGRLSMFIATIVVAACAGCGNKHTGTPAGEYIVTITGIGSTSTITRIGLIIQ